MNDVAKQCGLLAVMMGLGLTWSPECRADVKAWGGKITIPTYPWQDDVNPKFWAMEGGPKLSTTVKGSIIYPYTMQDHLLRTKVDRTYKALFLENEFLKVTCLPELGGRLHSVLDKTEGKEMFHTSSVIKPGMIAMRGAWISGGVEWNTGPHGHTVGIVSPVDALIGRNRDGSAFIEINNVEKIFRTRWTVRVTLHPGKAYLDERIRIANPTDGVHPYYFWNCTAFPNRPGTRFIYPMTLGTDHNGREFFKWPIHEGKDLSWLKNYERYTSIFSVQCEHDFFGAYDVDADRGIVQFADHRQLSGKKAWTWGNWDFGLRAQQNLTDKDGPYIEVQSGPLPTQSDYGMLGPREEVAWQEYWYPVHGLGDGFEYATKDLATQSAREGGTLRLRILATGEFPAATCRFRQKGKVVAEERMDLSPRTPFTMEFVDAGDVPVAVTVKTQQGRTLAAFTTPLPIDKVDPPDPARFVEKPDDQLTVEEACLKGRKFDRDTNRSKAREYYEKALTQDSGHVPSLRGLAILDSEAGQYEQAAPRLRKALERDGDDGLSWYFLGACHFRLGDPAKAVDCGYRAARCFGTVSLGLDLAGRGFMQMQQHAKAVDAFSQAVEANANDVRAQNHLALALYASGGVAAATDRARQLMRRDATGLVPKALLALIANRSLKSFAQQFRTAVGEEDFEMLETSLVFADLGLFKEAARLLAAVCVEGVPDSERSPLPLYYLAYYQSLKEDGRGAESSLKQASALTPDFVFPSRPEAVSVLQHAVRKNPNDANAHLHLGNLLSGLGRVDEAVPHWKRASELAPTLSLAFRNLGLYYGTVKNDLTGAQESYRKAIAARAGDQTLYRDLADFLIADGKREEAIVVLETMPFEGVRRADVLIMLAQAYVDEKRHTDAIDLLESTPYFVNWEGQDITWVLFNAAHVARGEQRFAKKDYQAALADFEAALTYPENIGVGRSDKPEEAEAQYWRGKALEALGRLDDARSAWQTGASLPEASDKQNEHRKRCRQALQQTQQTSARSR